MSEIGSRRSGRKLYLAQHDQTFCLQSRPKIWVWLRRGCDHSRSLVLSRTTFGPAELHKMSTDGLILPPQLEKLTAFIDQKPEALALGDNELRVEALRATKYLYDLGM